MIPNLIIGGAAANKLRSAGGGDQVIDYLGSVILTGTSGTQNGSSNWNFGTVERDDLSAVDQGSAPYSTLTAPAGAVFAVVNFRPRAANETDSYSDIQILVDGSIKARHINHYGWYAADGVGGAIALSGGETISAKWISNSSASSPSFDSRFSVDFYGE